MRMLSNVSGLIQAPAAASQCCVSVGKAQHVEERLKELEVRSVRMCVLYVDVFVFMWLK